MVYNIVFPICRNNVAQGLRSFGTLRYQFLSENVVLSNTNILNKFCHKRPQRSCDVIISVFCCNCNIVLKAMMWSVAVNILKLLHWLLFLECSPLNDKVNFKNLIKIVHSILISSLKVFIRWWTLTTCHFGGLENGCHQSFIFKASMTCTIFKLCKLNSV